MSIVLSILQILGMILLVILGIIVVVVAFVLIAPFFYELEGVFHETRSAKLRLSGFLHLIRGRVSYEDDLVYGEFWIFWKKITFSYELKNSEDDETEAKEEEKQKDKQKPEKKAPSEKVSFIDRLKRFVEKIRDVYPRIKKIITDDRNKQAVIHLKNELFYFVKILLPKKSKVHAAFSTGSPDTTGQLCGGLACFPVIYQKGWSLRPDFTAEEAFFDGEFWGKGRIHVFQLVGILLRIIFDKNCRRMYTMIDRVIKRIKNRQV